MHCRYSNTKTKIKGDVYFMESIRFQGTLFLRILNGNNILGYFKKKCLVNYWNSFLYF